MAEITDVDIVSDYWTELARVIPDTPLFPVDDFARDVGYLTPLLVYASGWSELIDALDDGIARVARGGAPAAARPPRQ